MEERSEPRARRRRVGAVAVAAALCLAAAPAHADALGPAHALQATPARAPESNIEVILDDSAPMRRGDRTGTLRSDALELLLVHGEERVATAGVAPAPRLLGLVEFGARARVVLRPTRLVPGALTGRRLRALRARARDLGDVGRSSDLAAAVAEARASNPRASAQVVVVGPGVTNVPRGFGVRTFVLAVGVPSDVASELRTALPSGAGLYELPDVAAVAPALAAVAARIRGDEGVPTNVVGAAQTELPLGQTAAPAQVELGAGRDAATFAGVLPPGARAARFVLNWDSPRASFDIVRLRLAAVGGSPIVIGRRRLRAALRRQGDWINARGIRIRATRGKTFLTLDMRGLAVLAGRGARGRAAAASGRGIRSGARVKRRRPRRGSSKTNGLLSRLR
jgi:hypothetical protein